MRFLGKTGVKVSRVANCFPAMKESPAKTAVSPFQSGAVVCDQPPMLSTQSMTCCFSPGS